MDMLNALTIDVEEWFQVSALEHLVPFHRWDEQVSRVEYGMHRLLTVLEAAHVRATCFVLGWVAERHPELVKALHRAGHEIACHGYRHRLAYRMTPEAFTEDARRAKAILEDLIGEPVQGFRATSFSVVASTQWVLERLVQLGFRYDSSVFPIAHDRYGMPRARRFPHWVSTPSGPIVEAPLATVRIGGWNLPIAGGGYLRHWPLDLIRWGIRRVNGKERQPVVLYVHPWELDPGQPRLPGMGWAARVRHYRNLHRTEARLQCLLREFSFGTLREVLRRNGFLAETPVPACR